MKIQTLQWHHVIAAVIMTVLAMRTLAERQVTDPRDSWTQDLLMKGAKPSQPEAYLCAAYPINEEEAYIYKFEALADASTAHHILMYGCDGEPSSNEPMWRCPPICRGFDSTIIFAWAKNAPPTKLPPGVGLRIGRRSRIKTIVVQVHYARAIQADEKPDNSGIRVYVTHERQPFVSGIYFLGSGAFAIPPGLPSYFVESSCRSTIDEVIYPFAFRTHAHSMGKVITGYQHNGTYHLIGKGNPQWPQAFYPVKDRIEVQPGDILAARCTYDSTSMDHVVSVGSTGKDEMCNFYIMFYTKSSVQDPSGACNYNENPEVTGSHFPADVSEPLPPNPELEAEAKGHHHGGGPESKTQAGVPADSKTHDILMPGAKPREPEAYLCTSYTVEEQELYIYKFEALANAATAHHILAYACDGEPFSYDPIWNCAAMCKNGESTIIYAWAKNAPPTVLPAGVGLKIGKRSRTKVIVLQVHYARAFLGEEKPDYSGIRLYITAEKQPFVSGMFILAPGLFTIPPGKSSYPVDISCRFNSKESIHPFAYRTHAHGLGKVITGYQYNGTYHEIGKGNPQWPQAFYPVKNDIEVKPGNFLAARCTYDSTSMDHDVSVGSTGNDEMCNFYIMFYTKNSGEDPSGFCTYNENPELTGSHFPADVSEPLPPNPELEAEAKGHHHGGPGGETDIVVLANKILDVLMPGAKPDKPGAYLCTSSIVPDMESYIYKFEDLNNASLAHQIMVYGCDGEPYSSEPMWDCTLNICKGGKITVMYGWDKNVQPIVLPSGVGMRIGQNSRIRSVVLKVHYVNAFKADDKPDNSGLRFYITDEKQPFVAGIYLLAATDFTIPPRYSSYTVDISCTFTLEESVYPIYYRVHTHRLGKVLSGYHYNGTYHLIGKGNPHWPQAFFPVESKLVVKPGDVLALRGTFDSSSVDHAVEYGPRNTDEMCDYYVMFYTKNTVKDPSGQCTSNRKPELTGFNLPADASEPLPPNPKLEAEATGQFINPSDMSVQTNTVVQEEDKQHAHQALRFEHKLEFNSSWPSEKIELGQIGGLATDADGNVYIFHRGSRQWTAESFSFDNDFMDQNSPITEDVIVVLDSKGHLLRKFGAGQYFMPHGIEVDNAGNIWLTDVALHQVFRILPGETKPSLVLGEKFKHGSDLSHFCKPSDVAVLSTGEFFVSDGYCNTRVLKYSKDGILIKAWDNPATPFNVPHSIAVSEENHLVCVADRENGQVQCFDLDGNFKHIIKHPEFGTRLFAIEYSSDHGGVLYAVNGPSLGVLSDHPVQGFTLDVKTGELLEIWNVPQHLRSPHDVCAHAASQSVYVGELTPQVVWKFFRVITPEDMERRENDGGFTGAIIVGSILSGTVILLLIIILLVRAHNLGKLNCCNKKLSGILGNSHNGFDKLKTEDSDNDSDHGEHVASKKLKNKA